MNTVIRIMIYVRNVSLSDNSRGNYSSCGVCLSVWEGEFFIHQVPRRLRADWSLCRVFPHQSCDDLAAVSLKSVNDSVAPGLHKKGPWKIVDAQRVTGSRVSAGYTVLVFQISLVLQLAEPRSKY